MLRIGKVESGSGIPEGSLFAVSGKPSDITQHPGQMKQTPVQEGCVAVGEVVLRAIRTRIQT